MTGVKIPNKVITDDRELKNDFDFMSIFLNQVLTTERLFKQLEELQAKIMNSQQMLVALGKS